MNKLIQGAIAFVGSLAIPSIAFPVVFSAISSPAFEPMPGFPAIGAVILILVWLADIWWCIDSLNKVNITVSF